MPVTRRTFARLAAAGLSSALFPLSGCAQKLGQQRGTTHWPTPDEPLTPTDAWYFQSVQGAYEADLERYRLKVVGLVDRELSLSVDRMRAEFAPLEEPITLACVGNIPNGRLLSSSIFRGTSLRDLIDAAGVASEATGAVITGLDGFVAFQSLEDLRRTESMVAYEMGVDPSALAPLPIDHGFPLRLLTPGLYGYMQPKWIDAITFVDQGGHHEVLRRSLDYLEGKIQLASGFSRPRGGARSAGRVEVLGYAFGDGRPIAEVELGIDGGGWQRTEIVYNAGADALPTFLWCLWRFDWDATPGVHTLKVRARYQDGETQVEAREFPYSGGSIASMHVNIEGDA
jgi:DMSO/TMAO reductase YedYZ molybdopterin-dependent catalytic subunit